MSTKLLRLPLALILAIAASALPAVAQNTTDSAHVLNVYGPGGPLGPMKECAEIFSRNRGVEVKVTAGPEDKWIEQAKQDADIIFGGAEYMLTQFVQKHPGLVDEKTRAEIYVRAAGILVRKGNPKKLELSRT